MPTNILLIMADQLRADALACNGNPVIDTPNLDRLARSGVNCTACYTPAPICVPARAALATGCYPHRCTGTKNNEGAILPGLPLLPAELAAAGYRTYAAGKLHYLPYRAPGEPRVTHGFQVSEVAESGRVLRKWDPEGRLRGLEDYLDYLHEVGWGGYSRANGLGNNDVFASASAMPAEHYVDAWVATRAIHHLDRHLHEHRDQPFFLFASFPKPHTAFDPPRPFDACYDPRQMPDPVGSVELLAKRGLTAFASRPAEYEWNEFSPEAKRTIKAHYYGLVTFQDLQVGRLLDFLEERGLREDTLVVFTADHGEMLGDFGQYLKESFYEGSARVPLIASHPGTLPEGRREEGPVGLHDLMPTLLSAAGAPVPAGIDGLDLSAMLRGAGPVRDALVAQCHDAPRQQYMVRDRRWKYIYHQDGAVEELYDLDADPHELCDLSGSASEPAASTRRSMRAFLIDWCRRHGDHGMLEGDDLAAADPRPFFRRPPDERPIFGRRFY